MTLVRPTAMPVHAIDAESSGTAPHAAHDPSLASALQAQLDRVLDVVWSVASVTSERAGAGNLAWAQLAFRLCELYPEQSPAQAQRLVLGELSVEPESSEANAQGKRVRLTRRELGLLRYLLEHRGSVVSRSDLMHELWRCDASVSPRTVDIHIHRLRNKLGPWFAERIETVSGLGYKLCFEPVVPRRSRMRAAPRNHAEHEQAEAAE